MGRPHHHGITPAQRASIWNHAPLESRLAQRASIWNHAPLVSHFAQRAFHTTGARITPSTTGTPHHERSNHTGTTSEGTTDLAQRAFQMRDSPHPNRKRS